MKTFLVIMLVVVMGNVLAIPPNFNIFSMNQAPKLTKDDPKDKASASQGVHWALLVAGSNGWMNYRHQADVCHAYQILKKHGLPDERIVVMMYDDLAYNKENPTPGIVINHPNGSDVYSGVPKDYTQDDVTPENFLKVLQGDEEAMKGIGSGKVIKSGPNDHVFVNFVDHGAPGLIAFPMGELKARQLMSAIKSMYEEKKFKQLVLYVEACESGSMFQKLLSKNLNVYATTAANAKESSYACYFDEKRDTYLGDVYSVKWMEDSDKENLNMETLHKQFSIVRKETNTSHVSQFGDLNLAKETVSEFQGKQQAAPQVLPVAPLNAVPSEDVPLAILYRKLEHAKTTADKDQILTKIKDILTIRSLIEGTMKTIVTMVVRDRKEVDRLLAIRHDLTDLDCYEPVVDHFSKQCFRLSQFDYALRHLYALVNMCEERLPMGTIVDMIGRVCDSSLH